MRNKLTLLLPLFLLGLLFSANAQCPTNIDFETGTLSNWVYYRGSVAAGPIYTLSSTAPVPGMHALTSTGVDYYGGFPVVAPGGGAYSFKLGHDTIQAPAYRARYYVHVPTGGIYSLIYHYAVVLENPSHSPSQQPRMVVNAFDSATGVSIGPCDNYTYVADGSVPGFLASSVVSTTGGTADVNYKPWTTGNLKFPGYGGRTVTVDFTANGCSATGHFGYGYVDMNCGLFATSVITCASGTVVLAGPDGYSSYVWVDAITYATTYGASQVISITAPSTSTTYAVILTPYAGYGCPDTLYTRVDPSTLTLTMHRDTSICVGSSVTLTTASSSAASGSLIYAWTPSTGLSCSTCASPIATPGTTTTYSLTVTDGGGCIKTGTTTITVYSIPTTITGTLNVCPGATTSLHDGVSGGVWTSVPSTVAGIGSSSGVLSGVVTGTATVTYTVGGSCAISTVVTVNAVPPGITGASTLCQGASTTESDPSTGGVWTSGTTSLATVGSSSGIVTAVLTGSTSSSTDVITYTLGCSVSKTITINPLPSGPAGAGSVCVGAVDPLFDGSTGGTWSAAPTSIGTITSTSGLLTGISAGTTIVTYTLPTTCTATFPVVVLPPPSAIYGPTQVCVGNTITDHDTTVGGSWSASSTILYVDGTGDVTGSSGGVDFVTYTGPSGCSVMMAITVSPTPSITGITTICPGTTTTLNATPSGGTWSPTSGTSAYVGSSSGIVTGIIGGTTTTITYTSLLGCVGTIPISVAAPPGAITGPTTVCAGNSITLRDATLGDTWSVSNGNASVVSTGVVGGFATSSVTGLLNGVDTIYYTNPSTGCSASYTVTVQTTPSAIIPAIAVCQGVTIAISDPAPGGTFTSGTTGVGTVTTSGTSGTGTFTAVSTGSTTIATTVITYSLGGACSVTSVATVYPVPALMTGTLSVCAGSTANLSESVSGTWTSSVTAVATVAPATGFVTVVTAVPGSSGTSAITYTSSATGCTRVEIFTVNPLPLAITASPSFALCASGGTTTLSDATGGGSWTSGSIGTATLTPPTGSTTTVTGAGTPGTSLITYKLPTGCSTTATVTVNALPTAYTLSFTGATTFCSGTTGGTPCLSNSQTGVTYHLMLAGVAVATVTGTGSGICFPAVTTGGTYTVQAVNAAGCVKTMTGSTTVTENTTPTITGPTAVCVGGTALESGTPGGGTFVSSVPANVSVTSGGVITGHISGGISVITYTASGCSSNISVTVSPSPTAIFGSASVCEGLTDTLGDTICCGVWTAVPTTIATIGSLNGVVTAGSLPGTFVVTYSLGSSCFVTKTFTVNPSPLAIGGPNSVCAGSSITETDATAGGTWTSGDPTIATAVTASTTSGTITGTALAGGVVTITYTQGCPVTKQITVNPIPAAISGPNSVCTGTTVMEYSTTPLGTWSVTGSASTIVGGSDSTTLTGNTVSVITPVTLSYVVAGCTTSKIVSVDPLPGPITGSRVCQGSAITETDGSAGGTWTSSIPTTGSINPTSGLLTGLIAGNISITYTLPTGCATSRPFTVDVTPVAIVGPSNICVGGPSVTLTDATPGVTWSIIGSPTGYATIGAGSGTVTGVAAGTGTVTATLGLCATHFPFSVVAPPLPISASPGHVCVGGVLSITDPTPGGSWSSGSSSVASVLSSSGATANIFGVSTGTAIITYGSAGCSAITAIVVDPVSPIYGNPVVCVGQTTTLYDTTAGIGSWSSSSDSATVNAHGLVTGVNPGVFTITYTLTTGCSVSQSVTVNPIPTPIIGSQVCVGSTITLTSTPSLGTWSSSNPSVGSVDAVGNFTGVSATSPTGVTVTYAMPVTGCPVTKVITVNPLPLPISGISNVCLGGTSPLSETTTGTWVSLVPGIASVSPSTGTSTVVYGNTLGTTTISYTAAGTGCSTSTTVNVASPPPAINPPLSLCQDGSLTLTDPAGLGSWYSGNPTVATVDIATGVVTPGSYGTSLITYVAPAGCSITAVLTVNPTPITPSGPMTLCPDQVVTYHSTAGGTWISSDPTVASIGSTSGTLTAIMPVTTTITYTLPTGCAMSFPVFVNTPPDSITGNPAICVTNTTSLSDGTPGGTWSSDHTGIASVDAFGTVTGNALGTAMISYMVSGTVCPSTLEVTVNPQPTAITGRNAICQGDTTALHDGVGGGTYTTSDPTVATVAGNIVTAVISGNPGATTVDITYSLGSGCTKVFTITVNPVPQPVSGPNTLCANSVVSLYDPTIGGTWSSASTSVATIDASGNLTGINPGGVSIVSYTQNGCAATYPVTVNTQPTAITGNTNVCLDGTSMLHETYGPGTWMSTGTGIATINSTTGLVTGISTGATTIVYTMTTGSCIASVVVNVKPLPTVFNITGGGNYCAGGSGVPIGLDGSNTGTTYLLYHGSTAAGTYTGTGSALDFGSQTVAGNYVAVATTSSTGCSKTMAGIANIVINPTVTPAVVISTPSDSVCAGTSATFTPAPTNGGLLPSYIWSVNGVGVGPGNTYTFVPANGDVVSAVMYSSANCPLPTTANSNNVTMVVMPYENARVSISSVPSDTVCKGTEVTLNAVTTAGGNQPVYLWRLNGMLLIGSSNGSYTYVPDNGDQLFVHLTGNYKCALGTDDSSTLRMQVDTAAMPIVTINANPGTVLGLGQTGTFTASVTNAVNPTYQWIKNGYPIVGATNASYSAHDFSYPREDSLTCMVTSNGICKITSFQWVYVQVSTEGVQQISSSASDFTVVPNPNKGEFTIKGSMSTTADENVTMELTDVLGQVVYHNNVLAKGGKISEHVQVGNTLANGMYILNLRSDSDNKVFHIVIEQ